MSEPEIIQLIADPESANTIANILMDSIEEGLSDDFEKQDIIFGLAMTLVYCARKTGLVREDLVNMFNVCLDAPIATMQMPTPEDSAPEQAPC